MGKRIWKFEIPITDAPKVSMPEGAQIIHVGQQREGNITLWAIVNPDAPMLRITFQIVGTGNPMPYPLGGYIGTVHSDPFVWHVFHLLAMEIISEKVEG